MWGRVVAHTFQPIVRLRDDEVIGYEAPRACRSSRSVGPDEWLRIAEEAGVRSVLEAECCEAAVAGGLPPGDALLFVNVSPSVLRRPRRARRARRGGRLAARPRAERAGAGAGLRRARRRRRRCGSPVAPASPSTTPASGYASLRHVLRLSPDFIKLDRTLVADIDHGSVSDGRSWRRSSPSPASRAPPSSPRASRRGTSCTSSTTAGVPLGAGLPPRPTRSRVGRAPSVCGRRCGSTGARPSPTSARRCASTSTTSA